MRILMLWIAGLVLLSGCGGDGDDPARQQTAADTSPAPETAPAEEPDLTLGQDLLAIETENDFYFDADGIRVTNLPFFASVSTDGSMTYEELYGPRVANATIGTGGLTAGFDAEGRLTVLNWPSPGYHDHVNYLNISRGMPNKAAPKNGGAFGGVTVEMADGSRQSLWLIEGDGWRIAEPQHYHSDRDQTVITELVHDELGLQATITDVVHPAEDVLVRNFAFDSEGGNRVVDFAHYANMNPTTSRVPRIPSVFDAFADDVMDFLTQYDAGQGAMLHHRPYTLDPAALTLLATSQPGTEVWNSALPGTLALGEGVSIAIGGLATPASYQAGLDALGLDVPGPLQDPYLGYKQSSELGNNPLAIGKTAGALAGLPAESDGSYSVFFAAGSNNAKALERLQVAREQGYASIRAASEADWQQWIGRARLPAADDPRVVEVARRALMLIRTAQDRRTGAIMANATPQTPYREDWVRDGAFFNYALLMAGYEDMVLFHNRFYKQIYRIGGTWDSFYYADGAEGGAVFPYEIDSQAFALWALWLPYEFGVIDDEGLAEFYPAIRDTARALMLCQDPLNGLQCYASEDDNPVPTQEAQGASTVYLALVSAARAAEVMGDSANAGQWQARAEQLRQAAISNLCADENCGRGRGGMYMVWPARLLDPADPEIAPLVQSHLDQFATRLDAFSHPDRAQRLPEAGGFFQYPMEAILGLAPAWQNPNKQSRMQHWIEWLSHDVPEPGVLHYAERIFRCAGQAPYCDKSGQEYLHSVGFPHIWSGTEAYMASAFVHGLRSCPVGTTRIGEARCR